MPAHLKTRATSQRRFRFEFLSLIVPVALVAFGFTAHRNGMSGDEECRRRESSLRASADLAFWSDKLQQEALVCSNPEERVSIEGPARQSLSDRWYYRRIAKQPWVEPLNIPFESE